MDDTENFTASANQSLKAAWIKIVRHDNDRLSVAEKYVLQNIAWIYPGNGVLIYARQTTIAHECGVSIRVVQSAYAKAKKFGYLVLETARKRGTGVHQADTYRMVIPEKLPAQYAANSEEKLPARIDKVTRTDRQSDPHKSTKLPARAEALTSDSATIQGGKVGIEQGGEEGTSPPPPLSAGNPPPAPLAQSNPPPALLAHGNPLGKPLNHATVAHHPVTWREFLDQPGYSNIPEERPSPYCDKHPNGTPDNCGACKHRRLAAEDWDSAYEQSREYNEIERERIRNWPLMSSGCGLTGGFRRSVVHPVLAPARQRICAQCRWFVPRGRPDVERNI
jgi:hypothetical protein